jgi:Uma2 family endonuclease
MQTETGKKLFTVEEYYKMAEAGIIQEDASTELLEGEVIEVGVMGPRRAAAVNRADRFLTPVFHDHALVRVQLPIRLNEFSEPQPDISIVELSLDFYERRHPVPAEVLLVLEISDTSLRYDRDLKLPACAAARIPEVWIEDLTTQTLWVFRDPSLKTYETKLSFHRGDSVALLAHPEITIPVVELLGPSRPE